MKVKPKTTIFFAALIMGFFGICIGAPVRSMLGADGIELSAEEFENPYISDGLVAMWDGEWNAGWGIHDPNAEEWKDLMGGESLAFYRGTMSWSDTTCILENGILNRHMGSIANVLNGGEVTLEMVYTAIGRGYPICSPADTRGRFEVFRNGVNDMYLRLWGLDNIGSAGYGRVTDSRFDLPLQHLVYAVSSAERTSEIYIGGVFQRARTFTNPETMIYSPTETFGCGQLASYPTYSFKGNIGCLRVYDRALTPDEVAYNYSIDRERFNLP